jgi:hypothetical protein
MTKFSNLVILRLSAHEDGRECSETSEYKIQTPGNYPEENIKELCGSVNWHYFVGRLTLSILLNVIHKTTPAVAKG